MSHWAGKIILITGAGSGMGKALSELFASLDARLILTDINAENLETVATSLPDNVELYKQHDVSNKQQWQSIMSEVNDKFSHLDAIINNAGMSNLDFFDEVPEEHFERVMNVNFNGVVYGCRYALPLLKKAEKALIVNTSSIFSMITVPCMTAYHASKFAVRGFSSALKQDLKYQESDIDVVCVMPGGIKTNIAKSTITSRGNADVFVKQFEQNTYTTSEQAARVIEKGMRKRKFKVLIGADAKIVSFLYRFFSESYHGITNKLIGVEKVLEQS